MMAEQVPAPKGVGIRIIGVVMVIVGALDMMLLWRDGQSPSWFFVLLIAGGLVIYAIGSVRAGAGGGRPVGHLGDGHRDASVAAPETGHHTSTSQRVRQ